MEINNYDNVPGPSPWYIKKGKYLSTKNNDFYWKHDDTKKLSGITHLINSFGKTILILDFQCYIKIIKDCVLLIWHEYHRKLDSENNYIEFFLIELDLLSEYTNYELSANDMRNNNIYIGIESQKGLISKYISNLLPEGKHQFDCPVEFSNIREILVLADYINENGESDYFKNMYRAIYSFSFKNKIIEVYPQDWFNKGNLDFGYQWITQVKRNNDGSISGNGIRIDPFFLDKSNRQLKK